MTMTTIQKFASQRPHLFWSTKNFDCLSDEVIVEGVLEYGNFDEVIELIDILGKPKVEQIFFTKLKSARHNFSPKVINYFTLFFKQNA